MTPIIHAAKAASSTLQRIAETASGERSRRAQAGAMVLRAAAVHLSGAEGAAFVLARARREVAGLAPGPERLVLRRLMERVEEGTDAGAVAIAEALVVYAGELERTGRLSEADTALSLAREAVPEDAETALHAGRVARKLGAHGRALALYRTARNLDAPDGPFSRLAAIGEAMLAEDPEAALGRVMRAAVRAGDREAAAVALEERAEVRRARGDRAGAIRDLLIAALRFTDPVDRARIAHRIADVTTAAGDLLAAREALLAAVVWGTREQRAHTRTRLHGISRALGDELGMRRWRSDRPAALVSLTPSRRHRPASTAGPLLSRWRHRLEEDRVEGGA